VVTALLIDAGRRRARSAVRWAMDHRRNRSREVVAGVDGAAVAGQLGPVDR
jgi:hypothetical protein